MERSENKNLENEEKITYNSEDDKSFVVEEKGNRVDYENDESYEENEKETILNFGELPKYFKNNGTCKKKNLINEFEEN